jgi:hypothetical protein
MAPSTLARTSRFWTVKRRSLSLFVGFNYWQETVKVNGVRCNRDDVGGFFRGPPGSILVPFCSRVPKNEANWASLRLGGEFKVKLWDRLMFRGDAAVLPIAYPWNDDYHYLRSDLGGRPISRTAAAAGAISSTAS